MRLSYNKCLRTQIATSNYPIKVVILQDRYHHYGTRVNRRFEVKRLQTKCRWLSNALFMDIDLQTRYLPFYSFLNDSYYDFFQDSLMHKLNFDIHKFKTIYFVSSNKRNST